MMKLCRTRDERERKQQDIHDTYERKHDEEREGDWLLGEHQHRRIRATGRWSDGPGAWTNGAYNRPTCRRGHKAPWLPRVRAHDPGMVEAAWSHRLACAAFSA